jgi:hypothetical protein
MLSDGPDDDVRSIRSILLAANLMSKKESACQRKSDRGPGTGSQTRPATLGWPIRTVQAAPEM